VSERPTISVVLPMLDEAQIVERALHAVGEELDTLGLPYEIICVDDGSVDNTFELLHRAAADDCRIRPVGLSRNFGKESAMMAGLSLARGDAVVFIDADLQHPPELLSQMASAWQAGHDVVHAIKEPRGDARRLYRLFAWMFNLLMGRAAGTSFRGASDFKLLDRQVVDALERCPERNRFFRGLVDWVGFRETSIPFEVRDRIGGHASWSWPALLRYSLRNLLSFTSFPLRLVAVIGLFALAAAFGFAGYALYRYLRGQAATGFTTVIMLQLILGGLILVSIGVISLYVAELYREVKQRPVFVIRSDRCDSVRGRKRDDAGSQDR